MKISINNFIKGKKAQITIFIILGILILASAAAFFYLRTTVIGKGDEAALETTYDIPDWAQSLPPFVEECMNEIAIDAFKKIGEHGGYINFNDYDGLDMDMLNPTESDTVSLSTKANLPVAYWFYLSSPNECTDCMVSSLTPPLAFIEQQVNQYMNRELPVCFNDFTAFEHLQVNTGSVETTTTVNYNDVDVTVDWPVDIKLGDKRTTVNRFRINLDLNFYRNYLLAVALANYGINDRLFLEDILMHLISIYSATPDKDKLPPISWIDNSETIVTWKKSEVEEKLTKELLASYIPLLQLENTKSAEPIQAADSDPNDPYHEIYQGLYDILFLSLPESYEDIGVSFEDLELSFFYNPRWNIHFDIAPRIGDILKPETTVTDSGRINFFPRVVTNYYEFFYDISFPVIVIIHDDSSLKEYGEEGYTFMFALEANIRKNKDLYLWNQGEGVIAPMDYGGTTMSMPIISRSAQECDEVLIDKCEEVETGGWHCPSDEPSGEPLDDDTIYDDKEDCSPHCTEQKWHCPLNDDGELYTSAISCSENCIEETSSTIDPRLSPSLFCNHEQRISKDITIRTFDAQDTQTNAPLPGVSITFGCGNYRKCTMEATDDTGTYTTPFPICVGDGYLILEKDGYRSEYIPDVSIRPDNPPISYDTIYDVYLEPIREKEVEAYFINITNMFRIKRWLLPETEAAGKGILKQIYHKFQTGTNRLTNEPIYDESGILEEINKAINALEHKPQQNQYEPTEEQLTEDEANILRAEIDDAKQRIISARQLIKDYENWYDDIERENVAKAALNATDAAEIGLKVLDEPNYFIKDSEERFKGSIEISEEYTILLREIAASLKKEIDNPQFLNDTEVNKPSNINHFRKKAIPLRENDALTVMYQKIKEDIYEQNIPAAQIQIEYENNPIMSILPGEYSVNMMFMYNDIISIPGKGMFPEQEYESILLGGAELTDETGTWILKKNAFSPDKGKMRFYFFKLDDFKTGEDMASESGKLKDYSERYRLYAEPEIMRVEQ